jgi:excisionase family DNA binding protein
MQACLTPQEAAELLKIDVADIMVLIERVRLRAIKLGNAIRIREADLEQFLETCTIGGEAAPQTPAAILPQSTEEAEALPDGARWCLTRRGKQFRVRGTLEQGAEIWPGQMKYPVKFPADFNRTLLKHFAGKEVPVGGGFDGPTPGSLGEFIKDKLKLTLHPAVYLAALLIDEGHAELAGRGKIRFLARGRRQESSSLGSRRGERRRNRGAPRTAAARFRGRCAVAGDYRRSIYWTASALCTGRITF